MLEEVLGSVACRQEDRHEAEQEEIEYFHFSANRRVW